MKYFPIPALASLLVLLIVRSSDGRGQTTLSLSLDQKKLLTQYSLDIWQSEQGLPQNSVNAILQTHDGYLWFGTQEGLVKFDGVAFTVFDKRNTPALKSNYVWALFEDSRGDLWVGTNGGGVSRISAGGWNTYTSAEGLANNDVRTILEDAEGDLWFGTGGGLCKLSHASLGLRAAKIDVYRSGLDSAYSPIGSMYQDRNGVMWVTVDNKLFTFTNARFAPPPDEIPDTNVCVIAEDHKGDLWVGSNGTGGAWRRRNDEWRHYGIKEQFSKNIVLSILPDKDGCVWFGTSGDGLYRYVNGKFQHMSVQQGLSDGFVKSLYQDAEGSLWIGTYRGGVNRLKDGTFSVYSHTEGLSNDFVLSVSGDSKNNVWVGTYGGGLNHINKNKVKSYTKGNGLPGNVVTSICCDRSNSVWIGTYGGGLSVFRDGRFKNFSPHDNSHRAFIIALFADKKGRLWIGTEGGGLGVLENGIFTYYTKSEGLSSNTVNSICGSSDGGLWIGTPAGLNKFREGSFAVYHTADGLSSDYVLSVYEDDDQTLWIGTDGGGLNRYKQGVFRSFTSRIGMYDDVAFSILDDDNGYLWMSSNKGVYRVSKDQLNQVAEGRIASIPCNSYGKSDGMGSSECNGRRQPSAWKGKDGFMWFATIKGVSVVDPHNLKLNSIPPPIVISNLTVDDKPVATATAIEIGPGADRIEIQYAGLSFVDPAKMNFKYRLDGYDKEWVDGHSRRAAYYTHLSPGSYTFRVTGSNDDGVWNTTGAALQFSVVPFFYQTYTFYGFCALAVTVLAVGGYRRRVATISRNALQLSHLVNERTESLLEQTRRTEHALAELARSEVRYKHIVENATDIIYRTDAAGRFTFINQKAIQFSGYPEEELTLKSFNDFVHPAHSKRVRFFYNRQLVKKIPSTYLEFPAVDRYGKLFWMGQNVQLIIENGEVVGAQAVARDITQRKLTEDALRESRRFIQRVADAMPTILFLYDLLDNQVVYVNNQLTTILGYTPEDLHQMGPRVIASILHPGDFERLASILRPLENAKDGEIIESELQLRRSNGEWCWAFCRATVFTRTDDGKAWQVLGSALDVTHRKMQDEAIRQSEERYRRLFEESKDTVFMSTMEGKVLDVNPAGVRLFGYASKQEMMSVTVGTDLFVREEDWEAYKRELNQQGFVKDYALTMRRRDGKHLDILETSNAVRDEAGTIVAVRGIIRDITERQLLIGQLLHAQKMESVGTLAGGVAHDFNNILALILTSAELLKVQTKDNPALLRTASVISSSAHRGIAIAKELLLFARSEKGEQKAVSLGDVVMEIRQLLDHSMPDTISIETNIERQGDVILGNSGHLHQVVMNLALNARDAMPEGGVLTIRVKRTTHHAVRENFGSQVAPVGYVLLSVSDTGAGMDEITKQRLFDPFYTTKERGKGTGLGLSIVHGIVKSYHGFVRVESAPGEGTTFSLYFPALPYQGNNPPDVS